MVSPFQRDLEQAAQRPADLEQAARVAAIYAAARLRVARRNHRVKEAPADAQANPDD